MNVRKFSYEFIFKPAVCHSRCMPATDASSFRSDQRICVSIHYIYLNCNRYVASRHEYA